MLNINDRSDGERMHGSEAEAWQAYEADKRELVGSEVLVSEMEVFDEDADQPLPQTFNPPRVGRVTGYDHRLLDDVGAWIVHPYVYVEVDGTEGWTDGYAHMWKVTK
jgi:hypothetical protein